MHAKLHVQGHFTFRDCAMAMEGGAKMLIGLGSSGNKLEIHAPQDIMPTTGEPWIRGCPHVVNVRSKEECDVLNLLASANIDAPESNQAEKSTAKNRLVSGKDIEDFFTAMDKGPEFAITKMLHGIMESWTLLSQMNI